MRLEILNCKQHSNYNFTRTWKQKGKPYFQNYTWIQYSKAEPLNWIKNL